MPTKIGGTTSGTGTTAITTSMPQPATAGNLLLLGLMVTNAASAITAPTATTPPGWLLFSNQGNGNVGAGCTSNLFVFYKQATGSDTAPTTTLANSSSASWVIEEWAGVQAVTDGYASGSGSNGAASLATAGTQSAGSTTNANDFVWSVSGTFHTAGAVTPTATWTVAQPDLAPIPVASQASIATGQHSTTAAGAINHTVTINVSSGTINNHILLAAAFKQSLATPATVGLPAGGATATGSPPSLATATTLAPPAAQATATSTAPGVAAGGAVSISAPPAAATARATAPVATAPATIAMPAASTSAASTAPGVAVPDPVQRRPLALVNGELREMATTDRLPDDLVTTIAAGLIAPYYILSGSTFVVPENSQMLFTIPIDSDGYIEIDGILVEV